LLKTSLPGADGVRICKNTTDGCDATATVLVLNTPITNTFIQLAGDGDRLQISNMSAVEVFVEVRIVG